MLVGADVGSSVTPEYQAAVPLHRPHPPCHRRRQRGTGRRLCGADEDRASKTVVHVKDLALLGFQISLVCTVLSYGLKAAPADLLYLLRRPGLLARSLIAVFVVMPWLRCS